MVGLAIEKVRDVILNPVGDVPYASRPKVIVNCSTLPKKLRQRRNGLLVEGVKLPHRVQASSLPLLKPAPSEVFLFGGELLYSFGHFLSEQVHRLWPLRIAGYENATVLFTAGNKAVQNRPFLPEVLAYFGVKNWRFIDHPCRVESLVIAEAGSSLGEPPKPGYPELLREIANHSDLADKTLPKKLAVMRGHLRRGGRILGEQQITDYLVGHGFHQHIPENLPVLDQIRAIYNAEQIIFSEGSAMHILDIMPPVDGKVILINRRKGQGFSRNIVAPKVKQFKAIERPITLVRTQYADGTAKPFSHALGFHPFTRVETILKGEGFIPDGAEPLALSNPIEDVQSFIASYQESGSHAAQKAQQKTSDAYLLLKEALLNQSLKTRAIENRLRPLFLWGGMPRQSYLKVRHVVNAVDIWSKPQSMEAALHAFGELDQPSGNSEKDISDATFMALNKHAEAFDLAFEANRPFRKIKRWLKAHAPFTRRWFARMAS